MKRLSLCQISALLATAMLSATGCSSAPTGTQEEVNSNGSTSGTEVEAEGASLALLDEPITGEITVSAYDTTMYSAFLLEAAVAFEEKHPGTTVNVETFSAAPNVQTAETEDGGFISMVMVESTPEQENDYITQVNTDLMSGTGADIFAADIIPYYRYADLGQLEDLSEYMASDPDLAASDYYQNIFEGAKYDGQQVILPVDYSFDFLSYASTYFTEDQTAAFEEKDLWTWNELEELGADALAANQDVKLFGYNGASQMFNDLLSLDYSKYVNLANRQVNFGDDFISLMDDCLQAQENGLILPALSGMMMSASGDTGGLTMDNVTGGGEGVVINGGEGGENLSDNAGNDGGFVENTTGAGDGLSLGGGAMMMTRQETSESLYSSLSHISLVDFLIPDDTPQRFASMIYGAGSYTEDSVIAGQMTNNDGDVPYTYYQAFAMNSQSQNKRTAWEFIKFMLSEEMQASLNMLGMPVNKAANATAIEEEINMYFTDPDSPEAAPDERAAEVIADYSALLEAFTINLNTLLVEDTTLSQMIDEEMEAYFNGGASAEEAASSLQAKANMYMNE